MTQSIKVSGLVLCKETIGRNPEGVPRGGPQRGNLDRRGQFSSGSLTPMASALLSKRSGLPSFSLCAKFLPLSRHLKRGTCTACWSTERREAGWHPGQMKPSRAEGKIERENEMASSQGLPTREAGRRDNWQGFHCAVHCQLSSFSNVTRGQRNN